MAVKRAKRDPGRKRAAAKGRARSRPARASEPKGPGGRPLLLLDPKVRKRICDAIKTGCTQKNACIAAGIGESTYYAWLELAKDPEAPAVYREFLEELQEAYAQGEVKLAELAAKDPQGAIRILERRYRGDWSRLHKHEVTGSGEGPIRFYLPKTEDAT